jgi:hypothetical protein
MHLFLVGPLLVHGLFPPREKTCSHRLSVAGDAF